MTTLVIPGRLPAIGEGGSFRVSPPDSMPWSVGVTGPGRFSRCRKIYAECADVVTVANMWLLARWWGEGDTKSITIVDTDLDMIAALR